MYFGYRHYQLHFDLLGLAILCAALLLLGTLIWQVCHGRKKASVVTASALLSLCLLQLCRGWMVPESAWLAMLGAIQTASEPERNRRVQELSTYWSTDLETMRAIDWYGISSRWGICHTLWKQAKCTNPEPSEKAVGIAREMLNDIAASNLRSRRAP